MKKMFTEEEIKALVPVPESKKLYKANYKIALSSTYTGVSEVAFTLYTYNSSNVVDFNRLVEEIGNSNIPACVTGINYKFEANNINISHYISVYSAATIRVNYLHYTYNSDTAKFSMTNYADDIKVKDISKITLSIEEVK